MHGDRKRCPPPAKSAQQLLWQSMRMALRFDIPELLTMTCGDKEKPDNKPVTYRAAKTFLGRLMRAGYVRRVNADVQAGRSVRALYQLVRNTGPNAPRMLSDGHAFDTNLQRIMGAGDVAA